MEESIRAAAAGRVLGGEPVTCPGCGRVFVRHHARRVYCSAACRWRAARHRRAAAGLPVRGCAGCRRRDAEIARLGALLDHGGGSP